MWADVTAKTEKEHVNNKKAIRIRVRFIEIYRKQMIVLQRYKGAVGV